MTQHKFWLLFLNAGLSSSDDDPSTIQSNNINNNNSKLFNWRGSMMATSASSPALTSLTSAAQASSDLSLKVIIFIFVIMAIEAAVAQW